MATELSNMKQSELNRAKFAYDCVNSVLENSSEIQEKYQSYVKKIPTYVQVNGLAGTFAFIFSKKGKGSASKEAYKIIYEQVNDWLRQNYKKNNDSELMEWIINQDPKLYKAITIEILALFSWLKRFAEGMIEGEESNE
ncbi:type III-B CRISPR module-associated protein Cmr5 [Persephonella sp.]|uniref:type III-B CRISPR module-associated protein Cmr5 n=1 Tax=Persephonella sp. TaxID=2060922 RepID=UPI002614495D|nr:type III-B CRISPR module-associated protein Cmr5 [Persephonella sp.]